jgi:hypothetical protein
MGEAKRTKTNHEMPWHVVEDIAKINRLEERILASPFVPDGEHEVGRVGLFPNGLSFLETTDHCVYRIPMMLDGWVSSTVGLGLARVLTFPCKIEFGSVAGRPYAEFVV